MIDAKEWPLEVEDQVVLDVEIEMMNYGPASIVVLAGTHGMVKKVDRNRVYVEFGSQLFLIRFPSQDLSLYRRSQHSRRRDQHDGQRLKVKKA